MKDRSVFVVIILILIIMLLALALRFYGLEAQSLWYDEAFSVYLAGMDLSEITSRTAADIQPPLYYYMLHGWIETFGDGEGAVRSLSLLFGVLSVPLLYAVAWQLFRSRLAGLLAALFLAISPLHVWYGQETRMYTLLTFLCLLSSYLLLLIVHLSSDHADSEGDSRGSGKPLLAIALWSAYTLINIAALYTHYFAFFVLAFQAAYVLLLLGVAVLFPSTRTDGIEPPPAESGADENLVPYPLNLLLGGLLSAALTVAAYVPWLPHLLTRYGADVSFWPGQLKLGEVLVDIGLFFVGGESVPEPVGILLAIGFGLVFLLCLLAVFLHVSRFTSNDVKRSQQAAFDAQHPLLFLLLYLLLPPILILALSYNTPKFNARYVMVSHPAFLLILAGGLAVLWERRSLVGRTLVILALVLVIGTSVYANGNAYQDPSFARTDLRGAARYLGKNVAADETIILVSGHMFPLFDYYAPGVERHLLPDSPTLDTTQTLDYSIAADLIDWLADRGGVWVVLWQDDVVDPAGYLTSMLAKVGEEQPVERTFAQVDVRHYRLPPDAQFTATPSIDHPVDFNFGNQIRLLGYTQTDEREVTLFWEALQPLEEDLRISLTLRDPEGQNWGQWDGRPTAYMFPTDRWREGQIVPGHYDLALVPGAPPGDYGLEVGVYTEDDAQGLDVLDQAGAAQGKRAMLGGVKLAVSTTTPDQVETPNPVQVDMGGGLSLQGWDLDRTEAQPGDRLVLTLVWSVEAQPHDDYLVWVSLTDAAGQTQHAGSFPPTNLWHPTSIWSPGQAWRGQSTFRLPIQVQPGATGLSVQLTDSQGAALGQPAGLTDIVVLPTDRIFARPHPQSPRQANFDNKILLLGADLVPEPVAPGEQLASTLYWQAQAEMDIPYSVFIHLLGSDGRVVAGYDGEPQNGARPTTGWVPGEYITDLHQVSIPADLAPGDYVVEVGLYDAGAPEMPRLPILGDEGQVETDRVIFGPAQVR